MGYLKRSFEYLVKQKAKYAAIGIPIREVIRLRRSPYLLDTTTIIFDKKIRINSPYWFLHGLKEIYFDESYLFETEKKDPLIIDCGANIGLSIIFFKKKHPGARVIAFEPDPQIFELLKSNISSFDLNNVELNQKAVWMTTGTLSFISDGGVGGSLSSDNASGSSGTVASIRLRDYLEHQHVDFLKIDIEGAEYDVLEDCKDVLHKADKIFIEYHSFSESDQKLDRILNILKLAGFRVYIKEAWVIKERPYTELKDGTFDLQLNIFAYKKPDVS